MSVGTPVRFTLWEVVFHQRKPNQPDGKPDEHEQRVLLVATADPTGQDLWEVTKKVVVQLGGGQDLSLQHARKVCEEVRGLAVAQQRIFSLSSEGVSTKSPNQA